jgi:hypothetical protein
MHFRWGLLLAVLSATGAMIGCHDSGGGGAPSNPGTQSASSGAAAADVTPESVGLGPDAKSMGADSNGLYWFKVPVRDASGKPLPDKFDNRVYNPKVKMLYEAVQEPGGNWKMTPVADVTPESLHLGPGARFTGRDELGRDWFELGDKSEPRAYDPKTKKLFRAVKESDGNWKLTEIQVPTTP